MAAKDLFDARTTLQTGADSYTAYRLGALTDAGIGAVDTLPYAIKVLLESCLRHADGYVVTEEHVRALASYDASHVTEQEIAFKPGRVVLQDFTGVPAIVDFAALRSAMRRMQGDVERVNPLIRADLVIDHSVQVDAYGTAQAQRINTEREFERNRERYEFLKWGQGALASFSVVPPATGIVHQVNLEHLAGCVLIEEDTAAGERVVFPDSLVGTDSHTTMINGLGVVGWGVGGIEAEACMLGQPIYMLIPEVVGFELVGRLREGATATDLVLRVTQLLREHGVVSKFVEFHGDGLDALTLADRATIANMAPEYGATVGFFPIDQKTLDYLDLTGRDPDHIELVERYVKLQGLWREPARRIRYGADLQLDLASVQPALAGPKRPQDRILLADMQPTWRRALATTFGRTEPAPAVPTEYQDAAFDLADGAVTIAAVTSCTNTSNPAVLIGAGLLAKRANERGLRARPWVKTSLAPGSRVVTDYLERAGLAEHLDAIGFYTVGYGCTTCIGNSGPLPDPIAAAVEAGDLVVASVLSGNRNFEGRISPHIKANYLASPALVVAYALAGTVDLDLYRDPLAQDADGRDVFLKDLWPTDAEIAEVLGASLSRQQFIDRYANVFEGPAAWRELRAPTGAVYAFDDRSTYIQEPPFFVDMPLEAPPIRPIEAAQALCVLGHSVTTDHISPAGAIPADGPAGRYLIGQGVAKRDFNSFGSRRGNDRVMTRGTFANIRIKNRLAPGTEGGYTTYLGPDADLDGPFPLLTYTSDVKPRHGEVCSIYDASVKYQQHGIGLVVLAGTDYGMGSSRDWAAKGTFLLGVRAVIAESYERIHRSNLVGMGVLPLQFLPGEGVDALGLTGHETFDITVDGELAPLAAITVRARDPQGATTTFQTKARVDTPVEVEYYHNGGILHTVLRRLAREG